MAKKFTEDQLEKAFVELISDQGIAHYTGDALARPTTSEVLLKDDLQSYLTTAYQHEGLTISEADTIIRYLESFSASDLYESNKEIMHLISNGFKFEREDRSQQDIWIHFIDYPSAVHLEKEEDKKSIAAELKVAYTAEDKNIYRFVNQLEIYGYEKRIPDGIIYINGIPLVVLEFKSAIREEATIHTAYVQLTTRYRRDIPELFKYNAFCIISDGVNNKAGSFFADYEFYYAWRKIQGYEKEVDGIPSMHTLVQGLLDKVRMRDVIHNFIYLPDSSKHDVKVLCRYPQYYAARKLFDNIKAHQKPIGDGKGGTYFGATGCGKSYTMLFLSRLLMRSTHFASPTLILITDRTDLDDQLSKTFTNAKRYIGDENIISVESRSDLRALLQGRNSGGVFLTTIHKFTEDTKLLTDRTNVICISDEAHRSQINLDQKIKITDKGVKRTYGFAKYLHDSLPNATYVGFTGTPIDATLDVFGEIVDQYTMKESVDDEITVKLVYEGRAAKVFLNEEVLQLVESYYKQCEVEGTNEYQVEQSKKAVTNMNSILGDPDRLQAMAQDLVAHYEQRVAEGASVKGKAMIACSSREIAYDLYKYIIALRPSWAEVRVAADDVELTDRERKEIKPMAMVKMIMTRNKDDDEKLYKQLGTKEYRKELDRQFKEAKSNFKIAIVVDMWLTGFDVPFLDTIYIDKPLQKHSLIQTISRVNRKYEGKHKGLVVDYIGIRKNMNLALKKYSDGGEGSSEDIKQSISIVRDHLDLLSKLFHRFDSSDYFTEIPLQQLNCLNNAADYAMSTKRTETRFMAMTQRLKAAYDICCGTDVFTQDERDYIHFYFAIRSIIYKLNKGDAPDIDQMNRKVRNMIAEAIKSNGVEEVLKIGEESSEIDIFDDDYLALIDKIKLPNTKIKLLEKMLARAIDAFKKTNKSKGVDFSKKFRSLVDRYNERKEDNKFKSEVMNDFADEIVKMYNDLKTEMNSFNEMGISFEEKAFFDILKSLTIKYNFTYPDDKLTTLAKAVKEVVDSITKYTDWFDREDIKAELRVDLIILLDKHGYPPVDQDEVYKEIFEQAENFKRNR